MRYWGTFDVGLGYGTDTNNERVKRKPNPMSLKSKMKLLACKTRKSTQKVQTSVRPASWILITWSFDSPYAISYWWSFGTEPLPNGFSRNLHSKYIWDTTLTFSCHVTSSGTWALAISYRCSIVTESVSPAVFEIMLPKLIGFLTVTFRGHVTSSITCLFDSRYASPYWWSINGTEPLFPTVFEIFGPSKC